MPNRVLRVMPDGTTKDVFRLKGKRSLKKNKGSKVFTVRGKPRFGIKKKGSVRLTGIDKNKNLTKSQKKRLKARLKKKS